MITIAYSFTNPPDSQGGKLARCYYLSKDGEEIYFGHKRRPGQDDVELGRKISVIYSN